MEDDEYGVFRCGSAECFALLAKAARTQEVTPCREGELEVWRDGRWRADLAAGT